MGRWKPCKRRVFLRRLRRLGFNGPYAGTRHQFMVLGQHRLAVPSNPEYSAHQLIMMIREIQGIVGRTVSQEEWDAI